MLASYSTADTTLLQARDRADSILWDLMVLDSGATPGMTPGYWAVVASVQPTREAAERVCATHSLPVGDRCYARKVG